MTSSSWAVQQDLLWYKTDVFRYLFWFIINGQHSQILSYCDMAWEKLANCIAVCLHKPWLLLTHLSVSSHRTVFWSFLSSIMNKPINILAAKRSVISHFKLTDSKPEAKSHWVWCFPINSTSLTWWGLKITRQGPSDSHPWLPIIIFLIISVIYNSILICN